MNTNPKVTFALFGYNQKDYITESCMAVAQQTYENLEIIFSDDLSPDNTYDLMCQVAEKFPNRNIILNQNNPNLGISAHVNKCLEMSTGEIVLLAAGDDISYPNRVEKIVKAFENPKALLVHSKALKFDEQGKEFGEFIPPVETEKMDIYKMATCFGIYLGATAGFKMDFYKKFGPIKYKHAFEDLVLGFRAKLLDGLVYIDDITVKYRYGVGVSTSKNNFENFDQAKRQRLKILNMEFDTLAQRRDDLEVVKEEIDYNVLKKIINKALKKRELQLKYYEDKFLFLLHLLSPKIFLVLNILNRELKYRFQYKKWP